MANKKLKNSLKKFSGLKEEKLITITGELGIPLGGQKIVDVPNRNGFVYVRLKSNTSEVIQAYNSEVSTIYGLPVLVARQGNIYKVIGRNLDRYRDWSDIPYLPKHGGQHSFNFGLGMGADVSWIYSQQFMPLLSYPSGTQGSMSLALEPHFYEWNGQWRYAQNTGTPSYTPYLPTITGSARMVLSYLDPSDNSIKLVAGTPFSNTITGSAQLAQYIPDIPRSVGIPLAAVRLVTGTTAIGWGNIYDIRDFYTVSPNITGSTFNGIAVQDEGIPLGTGTVFNFVGSNINATISGSVVRVFVTGSAGSANPPITGSFVVQDEGVTLGSALVLNVVGVNADISLNGTTARLFVTGAMPTPNTLNDFLLGNSAGTAFEVVSYINTANRLRAFFDTVYDPLGAANPPITGSVVYQDDYVTKGSALVFNFRTGILASASGTNAQIDVEFGTGTYQVPYGDGSTLPYLFPMATYIDLNPITASNKFPYAGTLAASTRFLSWSMSFFTAGAAHDTSNFYTFNLVLRQTGGDTTIATLNTKTLGSGFAGIKTMLTTAFSPPTAIGTGYLYISTTKTGTPADVYAICPALKVVPL